MHRLCIISYISSTFAVNFADLLSAVFLQKLYILEKIEKFHNILFFQRKFQYWESDNDCGQSQSFSSSWVIHRSRSQWFRLQFSSSTVPKSSLVPHPSVPNLYYADLHFHVLPPPEHTSHSQYLRNSSRSRLPYGRYRSHVCRSGGRSRSADINR